MTGLLGAIWTSDVRGGESPMAGSPETACGWKGQGRQGRDLDAKQDLAANDQKPDDDETLNPQPSTLNPKVASMRSTPRISAASIT